MNAYVTALKMLACGVIAVALTLGSSWSLVQATSVVRQAEVASQVVASVAADVSLYLAKASVAGLLQ